MATARFRDGGEARRFAAGRTRWGRPATAEPADVPRRLAQRWGLA